MSEEQKGYYAVIPAEVRYNKKLVPNAKLLYGEISALTNCKGYCWATNEYFAELYGVNTVTISRWIKQLAENEHIFIVYKWKGSQVKERFIFINFKVFEKFKANIDFKFTINKNVNGENTVNKNVNGPLTKMLTVEGFTVNKNVKENKPSPNNTFNITGPSGAQKNYKINNIKKELPDIENDYDNFLQALGRELFKGENNNEKIPDLPQ